MKTTMKILMFLLLCLFVYLSLSHLLSIDKPTMGAYWLTIFTMSAFIIYSLVFFLDLEIISKWVSIKQRMNTLEKQQKELKHITTSLYKNSLLNTASRGMSGDLTSFSKEHKKITHDIEKYLDEDEIESFSLTLLEIMKNPNK